jgi:UDP-glucose 4-epimerase
VRVLVTGAGGYVGRVVVERLSRDGHEVVALVRRDAPGPAGARRERADLLDPAAVARAVAAVRPEGVCHLAARTRVRESFTDPLGHFEVNAGGTLHLLRALRAGVERGAPVPRLVLASTAAVYGPRARQPITEEEPAAPASPYAMSKWAAEELVRYEAATGALGAVSLRCFNAAGAAAGARDPDETRLIPRALAVAAGRAPRLGVNGDGTAVRDYVHVADLADAYALALAAARPGAHRAFNVGGTGASIQEVIAAVEAITGRPVAVERRPPQDEPHVLRADSGRLRAELGWRGERSTLERIVEDAWRALEGR